MFTFKNMKMKVKKKKRVKEYHYISRKQKLNSKFFFEK